MNTTRIPLSSCRRIHDRCRALREQQARDELSILDFDAQDRLRDWHSHTEAQMRFSALVLAALLGATMWLVVIAAVYGFEQFCQRFFQ